MHAVTVTFRARPNDATRFLAAIQRNAALFPLGLDFFFTAGTAAAALPRSTRIANPAEDI